MHKLDEILEGATGAIEAPYFLLPIAGGEAVYRERVYCYELYHQMRRLWPTNAEYLLNGEVDKRAHAGLEQLGVKGQKPDLLVHYPGDMSRNYAIIEVKPARVARKGLTKDLKTLGLFKAGVGYRRGIYLLYGDEVGPGLVAHITRKAIEIEGCNGIEIWVHSAVGRRAFMAHQIDP